MKTRLAPDLSHEIAATLYRAFLLDAIDLYASLVPEAEPVLYLTDGRDLEPMRELMLQTAHPGAVGIRVQRGDGLGERLELAFEEAFADGCTAACAIGTDHPTLPLGYVRDALASVGAADAPYDLAVGPADDGGYYLIAMNSPHPELFRGMPYSTPGLYAAIMAVARSGRLHALELPLWYDVDDAASLRRLLADRSLLMPGSRTSGVLDLLGPEFSSREKSTDA